MTRRWWVVPLVIAAVVDVALLARYETSPGVVVDRAILRTVGGPGCEQAVLVRGAADDQLYVIDTWRRKGQVVDSTAQAAFIPGAGLTPQSRTVIAEGGELDLSGLNHPLALPGGESGLVVRYRQQLGQGASWLSGPCLPFSNPFQSHLRLLGQMGDRGQRWTVYDGVERYARGPFQLFASADVWMGLRPDGRMGFEVLRPVTSAEGNGQAVPVAGSVVTVATLFEYPKTHLGRSFARQKAVQREHFYRLEYRRVLAMIAGLSGRGL